MVSVRLKEHRTGIPNFHSHIPGVNPECEGRELSKGVVNDSKSCRCSPTSLAAMVPSSMPFATAQWQGQQFTKTISEGFITVMRKIIVGPDLSNNKA